MTTRYISWVSGLTIVISTLLIFGLSVDKMWYREDDLGQIINGIIRSKEDIVRVFSADERDFIVPVNFKRSKANVISGFLRPLKHVFFTGIYYLWGLEVKAYLWFHVAIHALNALLFFLLLTLLLPLWLSTLGGFLFAFYPDNSWLVWIAATHNSLASFFLLSALLLVARYYKHYPSSLMLKIGAGTLFLLSLLARENGILFPCWLAAGIVLYERNHHHPWIIAIKRSCYQTWPFFLSIVCYTALRWWAFGIQTLDRTLYNLTLRFPFCATILPEAWLPLPAQTAPTLPLPALVEAIEATITSTSWSSRIITKFATLFDSFLHWSSIMFCIDHQTMVQKCIITAWWGLLIALCWQAYRKQQRLLLFLIIGFYCFSWQAFLAYPAARYINTAYPVIIALVLIGIHRIKKPSFTFFLTLSALVYALGSGIFNNSTRMHHHAESMIEFKQRYEHFFTNPPFSPHNNFIILGSPFVSDIQNSIQYFMGDITIKVAHELFATVAEQGYFGCKGDYRISGVASSIIPIPQGFRFISHNEKQCAWWMHFSDHPMRWSATDGAYRWSSSPYEIGVWHTTPLGKFKINRQYQHRYNTDISFIIDPAWIDENTIIVSWDTQHGTYITLPSTHLMKRFK